MTDEQIVEALRGGRSVYDVARVTHATRWQDRGITTCRKRVTALIRAAGLAAVDQPAEAAGRRARLAELVNGSEVQPITIRQAFYMAVSAKLTEKDNASYHRVIRDLIRLRLEGVVPWSAIEDRHRRVDVGDEVADLSTDPHAATEDDVHRHLRYQPDEEEVAEDIIADVVAEYTGPTINTPWFDFDGVPRPVLLCEKDSVAGVVQPGHGVPVVSLRGETSYSQMRALAGVVGDRDVVVLLIHDFDMAGGDIGRNAVEKLRYFGATVVEVETVALTGEQVVEHDLETRPDKRNGGEAVDVEALNPRILRQLVQDAVSRRVPDGMPDRWHEHVKAIRDRVDAIVRPVLFDEDGNVRPGAVWGA